MPETSSPLLEVEHLSKWFPQKRKINDVIQHRERRWLKAVNDVSFQIHRGENLGLVGESGCGKSTLARTILRLYEPTSGTIRLNGQDISHMKGSQLRALRPQMQMIFQDPYSSLDPRMTVREITKEGMRANKLGTPKEMHDRVDELLEMVGLHREHARRFPHEFSGGQRQRIGVARALAVNPKFIVCDEPTSALDVSVQAQVIKLFNDLKKQLGLTYLFICHDLAMVKYVSDRVAVMYLGEIVEIAPSDQLYHNPQHPYTKTLLSAVQIPDPKVERSRKKMVIDTEIQSPVNLSEVGCRFASRCPWATESCKTKVTHLEEVAPGHFAACTMAAQHKEDME